MLTQKTETHHANSAHIQTTEPPVAAIRSNKKLVAENMDNITNRNAPDTLLMY